MQFFNHIEFEFLPLSLPKLKLGKFLATIFEVSKLTREKDYFQSVLISIA